MSCNFSLQKSATSFSLLFVGAAASLLGTQLLPKSTLLVEQPVAQLSVGFNTDYNSNTPEVAEKVDPAGIMLGTAAVIGGAVAVALSAEKVKNSFKSSSSTPRYSRSSTPKSNESTITIDQASRGLQKKLLRLLHDERDTANRLLTQVKMKNPNKSINWYVEKVIYDLERDRGSY